MSKANRAASAERLIQHSTWGMHCTLCAGSNKGMERAHALVLSPIHTPTHSLTHCLCLSLDLLSLFRSVNPTSPWRITAVRAPAASWREEELSTSHMCLVLQSKAFKQKTRKNCDECGRNSSWIVIAPWQMHATLSRLLWSQQELTPGLP